MEFVKDAVRGAQLSDCASTHWEGRVEATEEWYKIGRDQLVPRDGYYDLRITGNFGRPIITIISA